MFINYMKILLHISPNRHIRDIQKEFNAAFPFLKLEFFMNKSFSRSNFSASQLIPSSIKLGDMQRGIADGNLEIDQAMKVNDLEKSFKDKFILAVQVFRKSGNLWFETTRTDNWTLQQQNNHGREITTGKNDPQKAEDYDLTRDAD